MKSWISPDVYKPFARNVVFYDGPSRLNGDRIIVVATAANGNRKIGHMVQLWILTGDVSPIAAVKSGQDSAICGDCQLRGDRGVGRSCYVEWWRSPENIHQALHKAKRATPEAFAAVVQGLQLRIGAYGDPVAVPLDVWMPLLLSAGGWTAYTHRWRDAGARPYQAFCMASVDNDDERREAAALGWRTFRVRVSLADPVGVDEVVCPASEEAGHRAVCAACELCRGTSRPAKSVVIAAHGSKSRYFPVALQRSAPTSEGVLV